MELPPKHLSQTLRFNLFRLRNRKGLTQRQLALELGVPKSTITYSESVRSNPSALLLFQISQFYQVPLDELMRPPPSDVSTVLRRDALSERSLNSGVRFNEVKSADKQVSYKKIVLPPGGRLKLKSASSKEIQIIICHEGELWIQGSCGSRLIQQKHFAELAAHHSKVIANIEEHETHFSLIRFSNEYPSDGYG